MSLVHTSAVELTLTVDMHAGWIWSERKKQKEKGQNLGLQLHTERVKTKKKLNKDVVPAKTSTFMNI